MIRYCHHGRHQSDKTQWCLTKHETINTLEIWHQNRLYTISLDVNFSQFITGGTKWDKNRKASPKRGFTTDPEGPVGQPTAMQKVTQLELLLGQIANYCLVISRNSIVKNSTSLNTTWQFISRSDRMKLNKNLIAWWKRASWPLWQNQWNASVRWQWLGRKMTVCTPALTLHLSISF